MRVRSARTLTIRGRNFSSRRTPQHRDLPRPGGRSVFVEARARQPPQAGRQGARAVERLLSSRTAADAHPLQAPGLAGRKFSRYTSRRLSPVVVPRRQTSASPGVRRGSGGARTAAARTVGRLHAAATPTATCCRATRSRRRSKTDPCLATPTATASRTATSTSRRIDLNHYPAHAAAALPGQAAVPQRARPLGRRTPTTTATR